MQEKVEEAIVFGHCLSFKSKVLVQMKSAITCSLMLVHEYKKIKIFTMKKMATENVIKNLGVSAQK